MKYTQPIHQTLRAWGRTHMVVITPTKNPQKQTYTQVHIHINVQVQTQTTSLTVKRVGVSHVAETVSPSQCYIAGSTQKDRR